MNTFEAWRAVHFSETFCNDRWLWGTVYVWERNSVSQGDMELADSEVPYTRHLCMAGVE